MKLHSTDLAQIFSEQGRLAQLEGFEYRPQQREMAAAIADALEHQQHLIVEAPTGIGKSLAYLVPALLHALQHKKKAVIATHTKNLQEQLWHNDLTVLRKIINRDVDAALLKGRRNYLCTTRLQIALRQPKLIFEGDRSDELARIAEWANLTPDGDLESAPFPIRADVASRISSEPGTCNSKACGAGCFFQRAKQRAREADLVIVNHALFFTLLAARPSQDYFLFPEDFVIFDEAQMLEQSAGLSIGRSITRIQVLFAIHRLFNSRTKKGLLSKLRSKELRSQCERAEQSATQFFSAVAEASRRQQPRQTAVWWRTPLPVTDTLTPELRHLQESVIELEERESIRIPKEELTSARRLLGESEMLITEFLEQSDPGMTRWVELPTGPSPNVALLTAPTSIAESVGPMLFRSGTSVILTSATLAVGGSLAYYQNRVGAEDARTLILGTPFNFRKQMRIVLAAGMPQPDDERYEAELPNWILRSIHRTHGRSLVLFTNAALMRRMAEQLREPLDEEGIPLLVQAEGLSRHGLLQEFRDDVDSVLFGLESFWMGVDVPGEALQHVIITRLPFAVPDHPLIQSRMEYLKAQGEQPFFAYSLPEAVLKLRQGVGRLIRRSDDTGLITILDSRIVQKSYGRIFLESLPRCPIEVIKEGGEVEDIELDG